MLPRYLAPAGTRVGPGDLLTWVSAMIRGVNGAKSFSAALREKYGIADLQLISSGRAAMTLALSCLRSAGPVSRDEVIVPGYTCYSVAASAILAGFRVRPCDIDPVSLSYDRAGLARVDMSRVAALISANLYGIPDELPFLEELCRESGVTMIDDAAQAMNARVSGRFAGTFGDIGLFSLDKGKNITSIQGGALAVHNPRLRNVIDEAVTSLPEPGLGTELRDAVKMAIYAALLPPRLYWLPQRLLRLGDTPFELDYPMRRYGPRLGIMADILFRRIDVLTRQRQNVAHALSEGLRSTPWTCIAAVDADPVYPRFPLLAPDGKTREDALQALNAAGIGASASYPSAIIDVPEVASHLADETPDTPRAREVSDRILTLPTHGYVRRDDVERMLRILRDCL